uniref:Single-stranded DNA-binding protein n=1 Tax=Daucus carota subsp. sativus TaxID=79200 RepID=A0A175YGH8_DAUCS
MGGGDWFACRVEPVAGSGMNKETRRRKPGGWLFLWGKWVRIGTKEWEDCHTSVSRIGGIRNNRRPLENEKPKDYANRCAVQWHRVSIYREKLGDVAIKHVTPGSILYLEGNLETKVFSDPITGLVRRIREFAIRQTSMVFSNLSLIL